MKVRWTLLWLGVTFGLLAFDNSRAMANSCWPTNNCMAAGYPCDPNTHKVACNRKPADNQVTFWQDNYTDANSQNQPCITFEVPTGSSRTWVESLSSYGFNDCISSIQVGKKVRLWAFGDDMFSSKIATYEPGWYLNDQVGKDVNDSLSSLYLQYIPAHVGKTNRGVLG